jgi:hypothetical protein
MARPDKALQPPRARTRSKKRLALLEEIWDSLEAEAVPVTEARRRNST